ncbi:hypothetical protein ACFLX5_04120 [Chloroflexota bacterium]
MLNTSREWRTWDISGREKYGTATTLNPSSRVEYLMAQFHDGVLPYVVLEREWKEVIIHALYQEGDVRSHGLEQAQLERALINLRKQHLWSDITDEEYQKEKQELKRQLKALMLASVPVHLPNLERAAQLLADIPTLWKHPRVTDEQREAFVREMFQQVRVRGKDLAAIEPNPTYQPLFAYMITTRVVRKCRGERTPTITFLPHLPSGIIVLGIEEWINRLDRVLSFEAYAGSK